MVSSSAPAAHLVHGRIQGQLPDGQHRRPRVRAAAQQRAQPCEQHHERERLGQVVVGAEIEGIGLVVLAVLRGQHQHWVHTCAARIACSTR